MVEKVVDMQAEKLLGIGGQARKVSEQRGCCDTYKIQAETPGMIGAKDTCVSQCREYLKP